MLATKKRHEKCSVDIAKKVLELEIAGLQSLHDSIDITFNNVIEKILKISGRVIFSGMGKSGYIARKIAATFSSTGTPAIYIHPAEAGHGDLGMITADDIVILLSNSGETSELFSIIQYCKRFNIPIIGISRDDNSTLIKAADLKVTLPSSPEASSINAPTTSTTMMLAYGDALAVSLYKLKGFSHSDFGEFHPGGNIGATLKKVRDIMHKRDEIPLIDVNKTCMEAVLTITSKRFGCVGVIDEQGKLIGMITDGDLRRHLDCNLYEAKICDVMTKAPFTITEDLFIAEALLAMNNKKITNIFVLNDQKIPVGILHIHDLLQAKVI